jgi:uncharacterized membrane protein HdeD (DUF308 family)
MVNQLARKRRWLALRGLAAGLFGLVLLYPGTTLTALVLLFGVYALTNGLSALTVSWYDIYESDYGWVLLIEGVTGIAIGVLAYLWLNVATLALIFLIATWAILTGMFDVVAMLSLRNIVKRQQQMGWEGLVAHQQHMTWEKETKHRMRFARAEQMAGDNEAERKMRYAQAEKLGHGLYAGLVRYTAQSTGSRDWRNLLETRITHDLTNSQRRDK